MREIIFDIVRGSFVDGSGIRTAVFFKGCNLGCKWCHNPESQGALREKMFYKSLCRDCGLCKSVCESLENFNKLKENGANIIVRVPVIADFNANYREMMAITGIAKAQKVELLPYHTMGENKYTALGRECEKFSAPEEEQMKRYNNMMI